MSISRPSCCRMGNACENIMTMTVLRGTITAVLWWCMWSGWLLLLCHQIADVQRFDGPWMLIGLRCLPLTIFLWGAIHDSLKALIWFELVILFYFVSAVEAVFAHGWDTLSITGLFLVVLQFLVCMFYIRYRGREIRIENPVLDSE